MFQSPIHRVWVSNAKKNRCRAVGLQRFNPLFIGSGFLTRTITRTAPLPSRFNPLFIGSGFLTGLLLLGVSTNLLVSIPYSSGLGF